jgi:hypothetical protein
MAMGSEADDIPPSFAAFASMAIRLPLSIPSQHSTKGARFHSFLKVGGGFTAGDYARIKYLCNMSPSNKQGTSQMDNGMIGIPIIPPRTILSSRTQNKLMKDQISG